MKNYENKQKIMAGASAVLLGAGAVALGGCGESVKPSVNSKIAVSASELSTPEKQTLVKEYETKVEAGALEVVNNVKQASSLNPDLMLGEKTSGKLVDVEGVDSNIVVVGSGETVLKMMYEKQAYEKYTRGTVNDVASLMETEVPKKVVAVLTTDESEQEKYGKTYTVETDENGNVMVNGVVVKNPQEVLTKVTDAVFDMNQTK